MRMTRTAVVSAIALALVGLLAFGAWAVTDDDRGFGPPWRDHGGAGWHHGGGWGPDPDQVREARSELAADLAGELGTSTEEVEGAFRAVAERRLNEAVAEGSVDQADVDEILAAYDEGDVRQVFRIFKGRGAPTAESS